MTLAVGPEGGQRAATEPQTGRRPLAVEVRTWVSGTDVKEQMDGEVRGVHPRNYRAGELGNGSWLGAFAFVRGPESVYGTTGSSAPAFTGTQTWEAPLSGTHVWDRVILV